MAGNVKPDKSADDTAAASSIAFRLLEMQQRLEAWDRLYNQEIGTLQNWLNSKPILFACSRHRRKATSPRRQRAPRKARNTTDTTQGDV